MVRNIARQVVSAKGVDYQLDKPLEFDLIVGDNCVSFEKTLPHGENNISVEDSKVWKLVVPVTGDVVYELNRVDLLTVDGKKVDMSTYKNWVPGVTRDKMSNFTFKAWGYGKQYFHTHDMRTIPLTKSMRRIGICPSRITITLSKIRRCPGQWVSYLFGVKEVRYENCVKSLETAKDMNLHPDRISFPFKNQLHYKGLPVYFLTPAILIQHTGHGIADAKLDQTPEEIDATRKTFSHKLQNAKKAMHYGPTWTLFTSKNRDVGMMMTYIDSALDLLISSRGDEVQSEMKQTKVDKTKAKDKYTYKPRVKSAKDEDIRKQMEKCSSYSFSWNSNIVYLEGETVGEYHKSTDLKSFKKKITDYKYIFFLGHIKIKISDATVFESEYEIGQVYLSNSGTPPNLLADPEPTQTPQLDLRELRYSGNLFSVDV